MKKLMTVAALLLVAALALSGCSGLNSILDGEPVFDAPGADEPAADEPVADEPVIDEPSGDEPAPDQSVLTDPPADAVEGFELGNIAPDFTVTLLNGDSITLSELRGTVVFLNFWATWCGPCVGEMPHIQTISENYPDVHVLAVDVWDEGADVEGFLTQNGFTFDVGMDDGAIASQYGIESIPQTYVIGTDGVILFSNLGSMNESTMVSAVEDALGR